MTLDHTCSSFVFMIFLSADLIQRVLLDLLGRRSSHWLGGTGLWQSVEVPDGQNNNCDRDCGHVFGGRLVYLMYEVGWKMSFFVWGSQHKVTPTWSPFYLLKVLFWQMWQTFKLMEPSLFMSNTRKICLRFSWGLPLDMTYRTIMNSRKSIWPSYGGIQLQDFIQIILIGYLRRLQ